MHNLSEVVLYVEVEHLHCRLRLRSKTDALKVLILQMLCAEDFKLPVPISFMNSIRSIAKNIYYKIAIFVINNTNDLK